MVGLPKIPKIPFVRDSLETVNATVWRQVNKVVDQMRRLPSYQINWPTVRDIMRDLEDKYLFMRRVAQKCLGHRQPAYTTTEDEHPRTRGIRRHAAPEYLNFQAAVTPGGTQIIARL